jgi:putative oxidoreductase
MKKFFGIGHNSQNVDFVLLVTRIAIAMLMLTHGIPKMGKFAESPVQFMNVLGMGATTSLSLAVFAEVICSVFVFLGLGTRLAVIPLIIMMSIAAFHVHIDDPFGKLELPLMYLLVYGVLFVLGSGKYSMDSLLIRKESNVLSKNRATANG